MYSNTRSDCFDGYQKTEEKGFGEEKTERENTEQDND
jgi:hypothetical protein